jgi:hypothetical protein
MLSAVHLSASLDCFLLPADLFQGGNDANLVGILNSCVYSFWGGLSHKNCDDVLNSSLFTIESDDFKTRLDSLIELTKSKLAADGKM